MSSSISGNDENFGQECVKVETKMLFISTLADEMTVFSSRFFFTIFNLAHHNQKKINW